MCRGDLSAVITRLMSTCLWSGWKWSSGLKVIASPFPCCPVNCECLWKKIQTGNKKDYVRSVRIRSYSGPHFPAFGLNTDQNNSDYGFTQWNSPLEIFRKKAEILNLQLFSGGFCEIFSKQLFWSTTPGDCFSYKIAWILCRCFLPTTNQNLNLFIVLVFWLFLYLN